MNFNLKASKASKKSNLSFGLNNRKVKASSILQDGSSSCSDDENDIQNDISSKKSVNRELAAEQAALRKRAEKAISNLSNRNHLYDYDADYESFSSGHQLKVAEKTHLDENTKDNKQSRYIASLMEKAKERKQEREIIMERKIAREQEAENSKDEYLGKDKFVTKGYKRVLEERDAWLERDKKQSKIEEQEDITKKKGAGVMGIYRNLDVAMSGGKSEKAQILKHKEKEEEIIKKQRNQDFLVNFEKNSDKEKTKFDASNDQVDNEEDTESINGMDEELQEQAAKTKRMQKIFDARDRYLERISIKQ